MNRTKPEGLPPCFLILGANGYLGAQVVAECARLDIPFVGTSRSAGTSREGSWLRYTFPEDDPTAMFRGALPTHVIMAARLTDQASQAEEAPQFEPSLRKLITTLAGEGLDGHQRRVIYVSSDAVFSGKKEPGPWAEDDAPEPGTPYGHRQRTAELIFAEEAADGLICRCSYLFAGQDGPIDKRWKELSNNITAGRTVRAATNLFKSPVAVKTAAHLLVRAALSDLTGVLHLPGERMNVHDFLARGLKRLDLAEKPSLLQQTTGDIGVDTSLRSSRLGGIIASAP